MNNLKHTQGKWKQSEFVHYPKYRNMPDKWKEENEIEEKRRVYAKGIMICRCDTKDIEKDHANARLIVAAPEMLEALIDILKKDSLRCFECKMDCQIPLLQKGCLVLKYKKLIESATGMKIEEVIK